MQVRVSARNTAVSEKDRELIVEKIDRLTRFLPGMDTADIHFTEQRNPRIAEKNLVEITLQGHGHHVRCRAYGPDHLTSVDLAIGKLETKLNRLKSKLNSHRSNRERAEARRMLEQAEERMLTEVQLEAEIEAEVRAEEVAALSEEYRIVKSKKVEKLTLNPLEAALRMDLVGHPFYFFTNVETGRAAVVYRRDDGDIGLIDEGA